MGAAPRSSGPRTLTAFQTHPTSLRQTTHQKDHQFIRASMPLFQTPSLAEVTYFSNLAQVQGYGRAGNKIIVPFLVNSSQKGHDSGSIGLLPVREDTEGELSHTRKPCNSTQTHGTSASCTIPQRHRGEKCGKSAMHRRFLGRLTMVLCDAHGEPRFPSW